MIINLIEYIKKRPGQMKLLTIVAAATLIIWSLTGVDTSHAHTWAEKYVPGFWSIFGFCSCVVIIFFARWFGGSGIQTRGDYYDK